MLIENPREYLRFAHRERFAMPAFNACNLEFAQAVIQAATLENAPVIVQTYPGDIKHGGLEPLSGIVKTLASQTHVPVFLHLDHGPGLEYNARCLREGYSSVMFDGFDRSLEDAIQETAAIARVAHALGSAVEGELGSFGGGAEGQGDELHFTDPAQVRRMFEEGVVDMLAVSVGSEHGKPSRLKLDLLEQIAEMAQGPLVLHGGSGIFEDDVRAAVKLGVVKINIGFATFHAWNQGLKAGLEAGEGHYQVLERAREAVVGVARHRLRLMGASGRALPHSGA